MYVVRSSDEVDEQIAQLPHDGAARFAELRAALELDPWSGDPYIRTNPGSAMRTRTFAATQATASSSTWCSNETASSTSSRSSGSTDRIVRVAGEVRQLRTDVVEVLGRGRILLAQSGHDPIVLGVDGVQRRRALRSSPSNTAAAAAPSGSSRPE